MIEYLPSVASSAPYVIGRPVVKSGSGVLTLADLEETPLFAAGRQSNAFDEIETRAIEADTVFHSAIVDRLRAPEAPLVSADALL